MDLLPDALALAESIASPLLWRSLALYLARRPSERSDGNAMALVPRFPEFEKLLVEEKRKVLEHQVVGWLVVSNIFYFSPKIGERIQFDEHIFQMGWFNHQLVCGFQQKDSECFF